MEEEKLKCSITPKGVIFLALGGYMSEDKEAEKKTEKIVEHLTEYLKKLSVAIIYHEGELKFVEVKISESPQEQIN